MNLFEMLLSRKIGGGAVNNHNVQRFNGTVANPFSNVDISELVDAVGNASAICIVNFGDIDLFVGLKNGAIEGTSCIVEGDSDNPQGTGIKGEWDDETGEILHLWSVSSSGTVDAKDWFSGQAVTLYILWIGNDLTPIVDGTIDIISNGTYDVHSYEEAEVNVPNPSTGSISITSNGTYDVIEKASAVVNVVDHNVGSLIDGSIKSIEIPDYISVIRGGAFESCKFNGQVVIPDFITAIGSDAFKNCIYLKGVTLPSSIKLLNPGVFYSCSAITSIDLPDDLEQISYEAFYACLGIQEITIPEKVTSIGSKAFGNCTGLNSFTVLATTPPTIANDTFYLSPSDMAIYVPAESVDAYKAARNWSDRAQYIQAIQE